MLAGQAKRPLQANPIQESPAVPTRCRWLRGLTPTNLMHLPQPGGMACRCAVSRSPAAPLRPSCYGGPPPPPALHHSLPELCMCGTQMTFTVLRSLLQYIPLVWRSCGALRPSGALVGGMHIPVGYSPPSQDLVLRPNSRGIIVDSLLHPESVPCGSPARGPLLL